MQRQRLGLKLSFFLFSFSALREHCAAKIERQPEGTISTRSEAAVAATPGWKTSSLPPSSPHSLLFLHALLVSITLLRFSPPLRLPPPHLPACLFLWQPGLQHQWARVLLPPSRQLSLFNVQAVTAWREGPWWENTGGFCCTVGQGGGGSDVLVLGWLC